jgi:hypothetical protein
MRQHIGTSFGLAVVGFGCIEDGKIIAVRARWGKEALARPVAEGELVIPVARKFPLA